jgi:ADP-ribosylglycohydrolase
VAEGFELPFSELTSHSRIRGCLLGGAVDDAFGAPVEFLSLQQIRHRFGPDGIRNYARAYGRKGAVTDDTQMTLFTAEGLLRATMRMSERGICHPPSVVHHAYLRWLLTQHERPTDHVEIRTDGWLFGVCIDAVPRAIPVLQHFGPLRTGACRKSRAIRAKALAA